MKIIKTLFTIMFCISLAIGCGGKVDNRKESDPVPPVPRVPPVAPVYELVLKYVPVEIKYTGSQAEKWMRDHGYTIKKEDGYYHIIRKDRSKYGAIDISLKISFGSTVIGRSLYDKHVQIVGTLNIMNGEISIQITREGKLVRVLTTK